MLFHWRKDAKITLYTAVIVVVDVIFNHIYQLFFAGIALAVIAFSLQDTPESFHWPIVNALGNTGHALLHTGFFQLVVKSPVGILKSSVAVEQWMGIRIGFHRTVKRLEYQRIIIVVADHIGYDTTITEIKDRTEIDLVYLNTLIPFELCYIGEPLLVRLVRMEIPVEEVLSHILGILCLPCAAVIVVFNRGLNASGAANTQNALVIDMNMLVVPKVIIDAAVTLVRTRHVNPLYLLRQLFILQ